MFNCCCLSKNTPKEVEDGVEKIQTSSSESDTISIVKIRDSKKNTIKRASTESEEEHNDMSCDDANNASALVFNDGLVVGEATEARSNVFEITNNNACYLKIYMQFLCLRNSRHMFLKRFIRR